MRRLPRLPPVPLLRLRSRYGPERQSYPLLLSTIPTELASRVENYAPQIVWPASMNRVAPPQEARFFVGPELC